MLWVPAGFAHGFVVTSDSAEFLYKTTDYYAPEHERSLLWNDPALGDRVAGRGHAAPQGRATPTASRSAAAETFP